MANAPQGLPATVVNLDLDCRPGAVMAIDGESFPLQGAPGPQRRQIMTDQIDLADRRMVKFERAHVRIESDAVAVERGLKCAIQHQFLRRTDPDRPAAPGSD